MLSGVSLKPKMATRHNGLANALAVIPVIIMLVFANTLIASALAGVVFIQLLAIYGWSKGVSLGAALLIAVVVHAYIYLQPKIRGYISARS